MSNNLVLFGLLALLTNTAIPIPFEPVLLFYLTEYPGPAIDLILIGSLCAAAGGILDLSVATSIRKGVKKRHNILPIEAGLLFYFTTFLFALLPLPFSLIRSSLLKVRPNGMKYAASIFLGRLPRYFILAKSMQAWDLPVAILIALSLIFIAWIFKATWNRTLIGSAPTKGG